MKLELEIKEDILNRLDEKRIVERFFIGGPIMAFHEQPLKQIELFEEIKNFFKITYSSIRVAGSARVGFSAHKGRDFIPGESDLDIAIVDHTLFSRFLSESARVTKGFNDLTKFSEHRGQAGHEIFKEYLTKGIIMTKFMPSCTLRADIDIFFNSIQKKSPFLFREISAAIYLDESFFVQKQKSFIRKLKDVAI